MAEASDLVMDGPRSQGPHNGMSRLESADTDSVDHHRDSLQRLLQKAALESQSNLNWAHPAASRTSHNLFLEGFRDCASEVIRFLTQEERVDDNSPLLVGLQSHLLNVSQTICQESVADLDQQDAAVDQQLKYGGQSTANTDNYVGQFYPHNSPFPLCLISPIAARSVNSSVSDTSAVESDMSVSTSSGKDRLSSSSEVNFSLCSTFTEIHDDSFIDSSKTDDVFHSPDTHMQVVTSGHVLPLRVLSLRVLRSKNHPGCEAVEIASDKTNNFGHEILPELSTIKSPSRYNTFEHSSSIKDLTMYEDTEASPNLNVSPLPCSQTYTFDSWDAAISRPYHPSMNHSSPLPASSTQSDAFSANSSHLSQCLCNRSRSEDPAKVETNSISQLSTFSTIHEPGDFNINNSIPGLLLPHNLHNCFQRTEETNNQSSFQHFVPESSDSNEETHRHSESSHQMRSILELKDTLFSRMETSSLVSGDFADVLLAVESCRFHEDPRVRSIAEELVHLIHNDGSQDEDDFDYEDDEDDVEDNDDDGYLYNVNDLNDPGSAVEMLDESSDWSSAIDMIEQ